MSVGQSSQAIVFTPPAAQTFAPGLTVPLTATGGASGMPVTFSSNATGVCTVVGAIVTVGANGTCSITASQAGNANYAAAANVTQTFAISSASVAVALSASSTTSFVGQPITYTATVSYQGAPPAGARLFARAAQFVAAPTPTGTITFSEGGNTLCAYVATVNGSASCAYAFASGGTHSVTATYSGGGVYATSTSSVVTASTTDQRAKAPQVAGRFLSERNNMILSNEPNADRQIDRLIAADSASSGSRSGSGFLGGSASGTNSGGISARLGAGPDASDMVRTIAGGLGTGADRSGLGGRLQADQLASRLGIGDPAGGAASLGPLRFNGVSEGAVRFGFSSSLSDTYKYAADAENKKLQAAGLGFGSGGSPTGARFNPFDLWIEGKYSGFNDGRSNGDLSGHFGLVSIGADYVMNRSLLVGTMIQLDSMHQHSDNEQSDIKGHGFMVGPYATVRLADQVFLQGRAAWGRSTNDISPYLTYTDSFDSERWLVSGTLSGRWSYGAWSFRPAASLSYMEDKAESYHDTFGVIIPEIVSKLGQVKVGPVVGYRFEQASGVIVEPHAGVQLIWNFAGNTTAAGIGSLNGDNAGPTGVRGRVELGVTSTTPAGLGLDISGSYDGIGASNFSAYIGQATVHLPFN